MTLVTTGAVSSRRGKWLAANVVTLAPIGTLAAVHASSVARYRDLVQEDGPVEWATVVALVIATVFFLRQAHQRKHDPPGFPWFSLGLAAFCVFFAGEEISWGQRAISYQPPAYFLEHNTQQELNLHNLFKKYLRTKYLLMGLLAGWGVALPLLYRFSKGAKRLIDRVGIISPGTFLVPPMAATLLLTVTYPWPYTGEVAECLFALGLLMASVGGALGDHRRTGLTMLATGLAAFVLGTGAPPLIDEFSSEDEVRHAAALEETRQLSADWLQQLGEKGTLPSGCGTHMRVYTWAAKHKHTHFIAGSFGASSNSALGTTDDVRRQFFLDPWNNAYWIWHSCKGSRHRVAFYSFGPNRRRDSTRTRLRNDDIGAELSR